MYLIFAMVNCMDKTSDDSKGELLDWRNHIIYFFFSYFELPYAVESNKIFTYILAGVLLIAVLLLWKKRKEKESRYCLYGLLTPIGTILIGVIASLSLRPIFIGRYIICSLGCLWLAVAIILGKVSNKKRSYLGESLLITVLLIITIGNEISLVKKEREYEQEIDKTLSYIKTISENVLLLDGNQIQRVSAYYDPSTETYVYNKEIAELTKLVYRQTNMRIIEQLEEIQKMDKTVDVFTIENTILGELRDKGYEYKKCGTYHIEHYEFSIYEIINKGGE